MQNCVELRWPWKCSTRTRRVQDQNMTCPREPCTLYVRCRACVGKNHGLPGYVIWLLAAGFHKIADDRGSGIVDRKMFCDRLRSHGNTLLRSLAIPRFAIGCDQLRSCNHMETKVLRYVIENYPITFWIPTHDSSKTWLALSKVT